MSGKEMQAPIYRTIVTGADVDYVGSVSVDAALLEAANIYVGQQVDVVDVTNGARLTTYTIEAPRGSGTVQVNGAAAHLVSEGDLVIIMAYVQVPEPTAKTYAPSVVHVDGSNQIVSLGGDLAS